VKFLFATTEVNKVPVTVLSRCQRFDLRRIPAERLVDHFHRISEVEQVAIEPDALLMIARAAEGSARDGLSLLDQAIAHGGGQVSAAAVRDMLGLADRGRIRRLLALLLAGDAGGSLAELDEAQALGIDPTALLRGLMEQLHAASRAKAGRGGDPLASVEERAASEELGASLGWSQLHRLWQLLLKGLADVGLAPCCAAGAAPGTRRHGGERSRPATNASAHGCKRAGARTHASIHHFTRAGAAWRLPKSR
jgi:DNA polymerase-3 subunit gamma/tau